MRYLLQLRHWQAFIILLIVFYVDRYHYSLGYTQLILEVVYFYFVTIALQDKIEPGRRWKIRKFKTAFLCSFLGAIPFILMRLIGGTPEAAFDHSSMIFMSIVFIPIAVVSFLYASIFAARSIRIIHHTWKAQNNMTINIWEDLLFFFAVVYYFPIGVWFIQPILNRTFPKST